MKEYIALDSHKHYSLLERWNAESGRAVLQRIEHRHGAIREHLQPWVAGAAVAVEATGNWYWIVSEIEQAGGQPRLVHPRKAKLMMGLINKTDKLDVHGLNRLQQAGTLPCVWIPPASLRDLRELTRTRMVLARQRTRLKNRLSATLSKYGLLPGGASDLYVAKARPALAQALAALPPQSRFVSEQLLAQLDFVQGQIQQQEQRLKELLTVTPAMQWLMSLPGVGLILAAVMAWEIGEVGRFASAEHLASYAGTTPRVYASGQSCRYGRLRNDVNHYLKWALVEAANVISLHHAHWPQRHVSQLYRRLRERKGHAKAVGAVARHLAEAVWHMLSRKEFYRDPAMEPGGSKAV
jgi:transposase